MVGIEWVFSALTLLGMAVILIRERAHDRATRDHQRDKLDLLNRFERERKDLLNRLHQKDATIAAALDRPLPKDVIDIQPIPNGERGVSATRDVVMTPEAEAFAEQLERQGATQEQIWEELEKAQKSAHP